MQDYFVGLEMLLEINKCDGCNIPIFFLMGGGVSSDCLVFFILVVIVQHSCTTIQVNNTFFFFYIFLHVHLMMFELVDSNFHLFN